MSFNFDPYTTGLPVTEIIPDVSSRLSEHNTLIVSAPPGAGKSTVLPLALLSEPWLAGKKILMLEPRRLAANTLAQRMASLLKEPAGRTTGYRIRFENKISSHTRIEVVTEGILTRMLQHDNALEGVGLVIFDEFHERSIHADIALALCRETQQILRPDLRIMIMSATIDMPGLSRMLEAPVVESKGRSYPVELVYTGENDLSQLPALCTSVVLKALKEKEGDILVFLPGQAEIRKCEEQLKRLAGNVLIHPLYGQLPYAAQHAAIMPDPQGGRKVVLATSIAETSITIEGIKVVIDSGFRKHPVFDPKSGLSGLRTAFITIDSADQRAGRAGRLSAGTCYRMWSKATHDRMMPYRNPEILEADLVPLALDLAHWGIADFTELSWLNPPPRHAFDMARELLEQLKATKDGKITAHGKQVHALPCHPRIGHMLIMARQAGTADLATDLAALLEERDPLDKVAGTDINTRIEALRRYRGERRKDRKWENIEKIASFYRSLFKLEENNGMYDPYDTGLLLAYAYPERIAAAKPGHAGQFQLANGKMTSLERNDDLSAESWLAIAQLDDRKGLGKIFLASPINKNDLLSVASESETLTWDTRRGGLIASRDLRLGSIVLQSKPLAAPPPEKVSEVISAALETEGESLLDFSEELEQWQNRILSSGIWRPEENWPDVTTSSLLKSNREWLWPYLAQVKKTEDLKKINLLQALSQHLEYSKQLELNTLAPAGITVPSGSLVRLQYFADGSAPVLAVRLQEVFGMLDTPKINGGKTGVVLHLLSPGFKPVQVTSDLRSFWTNTYFEVRKELKRRYPKHSWPEDPLNAEAVSGVKRRNIS